ncbi:MAG: 7-cyano-7-deazaguanine synthase [Sphingomicrobium sp.]
MRALLFSGGLDSTALAFWTKPDRLLFVDYGQVCAEGELRAATKISTELHLVLDTRRVDVRSCGAGDMAGGVALSSEAPEFWPYRNQFLITLAAMTYASEPMLSISIGTVCTDRVHPDGHPEFLRKLQAALRTQADVKLEAPAISITSKTLIKRSGVPIDLLGWAFSCHRSNYACGQCRGCAKHFKTFRHGVNP